MTPPPTTTDPPVLRRVGQAGDAPGTDASATAAPTPQLDLEVIVPAFNEQARIAFTLTSLADYLPTLGLRAQIRVIDNGSSDRTPEVVDRVNRVHRGVTITVQGCSTQGKGSAVARGVMTSKARLVGFCDADLATPAEAIADAVGYLEQGWPVVIGSRHVAGAQMVIEQPVLRRIGGAGFRLLARVLAGDLDLVDTQCGFKFFEASAARQIFSRVDSGGFAFDVEVLSRARGMGYPVKEFPVVWTDRDGSTFSPIKHGAQVTSDLWQIRRQRRAGAGRRW